MGLMEEVEKWEKSFKGKGYHKDITLEDFERMANAVEEKTVGRALQFQVMNGSREFLEQWDKAMKGAFEEFTERQRKTGRTTRQADEYIQQLFKKGIVDVQDHSGNIGASRDLANLIINRVSIEHPGTDIKIYQLGNEFKIILSDLEASFDEGVIED